MKKTNEIELGTFVNSQSYTSDVVYLNEYSDITVGELNEAVACNFLPKYHVINVQLFFDNDDPDVAIARFVEFAKSNFSLVLIQSILLKTAYVTLFFKRCNSIKLAAYLLDKYCKKNNLFYVY